MPREQTEVLNNVFFEQQEREKRKSNLIIFGLKLSENTLASNLSDESVRVGELIKKIGIDDHTILLARRFRQKYTDKIPRFLSS